MQEMRYWLTIDGYWQYRYVTRVYMPYTNDSGLHNLLCQRIVVGPKLGGGSCSSKSCSLMACTLE